ncbi:MAG: D-alanyl-D-alanine carboxypeptidase [Provencibacterium sp.]|jgi:D-alanyl-D-alanine carboxypeptidase (penicillin-binding protein 5/6)|nr:D-alanyl-D-alanine carboxypeptidase [Provencibacterium sp.]
MRKRFLGALAALFCLSGLLPLRAEAAGPPAATSWAYVVMDAETGQVLIEKNADERLYPASITKVLTVALALDSCAPGETVTMSEEAVFSIDRGSTHIALTPGEQVTVEQLAYAAMLASANDAANGLAEHAGGTLEAFAERMNAKAGALGAVSTHFVNASGLHDGNHYTTARDFARITRWALSVPGFREVFGADEYTMAPTNLQPESRNFGTYNCLTVESAYTYEGATGGKLGWTPEANHTFVAVARRGEMELILVALNSKTKWEKFKDAVALYDYCFGNFRRTEVPAAGLPETVPLLEGEAPAGEVKLELPASFPVDLAAGADPSRVQLRAGLPAAYQKEDAVAPSYSLYLEDELLYTAPIGYALQFPEDAAEKAAALDPESPAEKPSFRWLLWFLGALVLLLLIFRQISVARRRRRRRRLRAQRLGRLEGRRF